MNSDQCSASCDDAELQHNAKAATEGKTRNFLPKTIDTTAASKAKTQQARTNSNFATTKPLSLHLALEKLEEQKSRTIKRIDEFRRDHDLACSRAIADLNQKEADYSRKLNLKLRDSRKVLCNNIRLLIVNAERELSSKVNENKRRMENTAQELICSLDNFEEELSLPGFFQKLEELTNAFSTNMEAQLDRLQQEHLPTELKDLMQAKSQELVEWRTEMLQAHRSKIEAALFEINSRKEEAFSTLSSYSDSLVKEIKRYQDLHNEEIAIHKHRDMELLSSSFKEWQSRLESGKQELLSEYLLPQLHEMKTLLSSKSTELLDALYLNLSAHSKDFSGEFREAFNSIIEELSVTNEQLAEHRITLQKRLHATAEEQLSSLESNLQDKLKSTQQNNKFRGRKKSQDCDSIESVVNQTLEEKKSAFLTAFKTRVRSTICDQELESEEEVQSWKRNSTDSCRQLVDEIKAEVEKFKKRRISSIQQLKADLALLKEKAEILSYEE